jgi:protein-tyrosine phosphatase
MLKDRLAPLEGVLNFRDFGGYATHDGRRVAHARLYRSAHFHNATALDRTMLDALNIGVIADLRRPEERAAEPNAWPGERRATRVLWNDQGLAAPPPHEGVATTGEWSLASVDHYMLHSYETYPYEPRYVHLFGGFVRDMAACGDAGVIHCAAGKDRTGSLAALILSLLGVARETIYADYMLTNDTIDVAARLPVMRARIAQRYNVAAPDDALIAMMQVKPAYLDAYLGAIAARYDRIEDYSAEVLGVDEAMQAALREKYLVG